MTGQDLSDFAVAVQYMKSVQRSSFANQHTYTVSEYRGWSPISLLRAVLEKCPDQVPSPETSGLVFIADSDFRESIRRDISAANQDMVNGEWKGATVLAGSATEAHLLWAIQEVDRANVGAADLAVKACMDAGKLVRRPQGAPEQWNFISLIEVAFQLGCIKEATAEQARLGKNFRNLIHPGRAMRLGEVCDRGTALSALAAVELVVRDLS